MKLFFKNWLPVLIYAPFIFIFSSFPVNVANGPDKIVHFFEYFILGFFVTRGFLLTWKNLARWQGLALGAVAASLLGMGDEVFQSFIPGRDSSVWDVLADSLGALAGATLFLYLALYLFKQKKLYPPAAAGAACPLRD